MYTHWSFDVPAHTHSCTSQKYSTTTTYDLRTKITWRPKSLEPFHDQCSNLFSLAPLPTLTTFLNWVPVLTKFQQTLPGPSLTCVWGRRAGELMRSPVRASRVLSEKCQWNVKCLSKTLSAFCGLAGGLAASHVSRITGNWRTDPSTYQLPNSLLSHSQQAFTQHTHTRINKADKRRNCIHHKNTDVDTHSYLRHQLASWWGGEKVNFGPKKLCVFTVMCAMLITNHQFHQSH